MTTTMVLAQTPYIKYLEQVPSARVHTELLQTGWYRINENSFWDFRNPTSAVKSTIIKDLQEKLKETQRIKLETILEFDKSVTCEQMKDYEKELIHIERSNSNYGFSSSKSSGFLAGGGYVMGNSSYSARGYSYSNHYLYHKSIRDTYCSEEGVYLRATLKLTAKLKANADAEFIQFAVNRHIEQAVFGFSNAMKVFLDGLNRIEQDPVIRYDRYSFFNIEQGSEMSAWFTFYLGQLRVAVDYAQFLESLNLGIGVQSQISQLKMYIVEALSKLRRFESPGIYVLIIDNEKFNVTSLQLFDEMTLKSVSTFAEILNANPQGEASKKAQIKNYSIVAKGDIQKRLQSELTVNRNQQESIDKFVKACSEQFDILAKQANFEYIKRNYTSDLVSKGNNFLNTCAKNRSYYKRKSKALWVEYAYSDNYNEAVNEWNKLIQEGCFIIEIADYNVFTSICKK